MSTFCIQVVRDLSEYYSVRVQFNLEQATKLRWGSRGIVTLSLTSALDGAGLSTLRPCCFAPGNDPVPIVQEAGSAPETVWTGAVSLAPTGIQSPDLPVRSELLYELRYSGPHSTW